MKFIIRICTLLTLILSPLSFAEEAPAAIQKITPQIEALGNNLILIAAVQAQNAEGLNLDTIKQRDADWRKVAGTNTFMDAMLT